ncbi:hypothetical protein [Streptomyces sp. NBC_00425]|uniref:hypothetical protein n=1 Tax=Streptomyces sp. NBC_00425 TaxID=2975740 RepID=UPI002E248783
MTSPIKLATCTYQEFTPDMGTPVRTTAGRPRFALPYPMTAHARLITPSWDLVRAGLPQDAYEFQYRRALNETGLEQIQAELLRIAGAYDLDSPLVLLCFDKLNQLPARDAWCHRTHFGKWYAEQTGVDVPELGALPKQAPAQGGLF